MRARFWLHRAALSVSQINYVTKFGFLLFNIYNCFALIAYSDMVIQDFWCQTRYLGLDLGLSKEQTYYIPMSLYAIKVLQKSELKSPNPNLFT